MNWLQWRWVLPAAIFFVCGPALAGGLNVYPIRLQIDGPRDLQQLTLVNHDDSASVVVQIEVLRWTQAGGEEQLEPSRDFLATPPLLEIPAESRRSVRVGARDFPDGACETSYRLVITEIPQKTGPQAPVNFRTRMRLPLFARHGRSCAADVQWRWQDDSLVAQNRGDAHIQYQKLTVHQGEQSWPLRLNQVGYVLPGSAVAFDLPGEVRDEPLRLEITSRGGRQSIRLQPRD